MSGFGKSKKKKGKKWTTAIQTTIDGIEFKSKLEAYCYKKLKAAKLDCDYESVTYVIVPAFTAHVSPWQTRGRKHVRFTPRAPTVQKTTYTPDFTAKDQSWVIEVKGRKFATFQLKWKLWLLHLKKNGLHPEIFMPTTEKEVDETVKYLKDAYG